MRYFVTEKQMKELEAMAIEKLGIPALVLMERAAAFTRDFILSMDVSKYKKILIACGQGNNGADGLALARMLYEKGYLVSIVRIGKEEKRSDLNRLQYDILQPFLAQKNIKEIELKQLLAGTEDIQSEYDMVIDAVLGIGLKRKLEGDYLSLIQVLNQMNGLKLAMDMPTGIHTDTGNRLGDAFESDVTLCFGALKAGLFLEDGCKYAKKVYLDTIGIVYPKAESMEYLKDSQVIKVLDEADMKKLLERDPNGNKGSFGKLGLFVGSEKMLGAALLCTGASFMTGAGYVRVCTHQSHKTDLLQMYPETVLTLYNDPKDHENDIKETIDFAKVIAIGCGLGKDAKSRTLFQSVFEQVLAKGKEKTAFVIDADGLAFLTEDEGRLLKQIKDMQCPVILTPHLKEFENLSGIKIADVKKDKVGCAGQFAKEYGVVLVLKDAKTVIAFPDGQVYINTFGNDGMAVAGSGDVLTGMLASMLGQSSKELSKAVALGVSLHAMCGDRAMSELGKHSLRPSDMIAVSPRVIQTIIND